MLGSAQSIADPNVALNTIMAEELCKFAQELEQAADFDTALQELICRTLKEHQRIIFSGNGYSQEWEEEAARRGLCNLRSTADALATYVSEKNIDLVTRHKIFTEEELRARHDIHMDAYCKIINIEAQTSIDMVLRQILPAALSYTKSLCDSALAKRQLGLASNTEDALIARLTEATDALFKNCEQLRTDLGHIPSEREKAVVYYHDVILSGMSSIRSDADLLEQHTDKAFWPYPTYADLLFY